jgi:hypothetical protein
MHKEDAKSGVRVYIPDLLEIPPGLKDMPQKYWKARKDHTAGTIISRVGLYDDLYFVKLDGSGDVAFYRLDEMFNIKHLSDTGLLGNIIIGRFQDHLSLLEKMPDEMKGVKYEFVVYYLKRAVEDAVAEMADDVAERLIYFSSHTDPVRFEHDGWMYILIPATDHRQRRPTKS